VGFKPAKLTGVASPEEGVVGVEGRNIPSKIPHKNPIYIYVYIYIHIHVNQNVMYQ
jgi:hypothetical protein